MLSKGSTEALVSQNLSKEFVLVLPGVSTGLSSCWDALGRGGGGGGSCRVSWHPVWSFLPMGLFPQHQHYWYFSSGRTVSFSNFCALILLSVLIVNLAESSAQYPCHGLNASVSWNFLCWASPSSLNSVSCNIRWHKQDADKCLSDCETNGLSSNFQQSPYFFLKPYEHGFYSLYSYQNVDQSAIRIDH